jgi:hypothetical protein
LAKHIVGIDLTPGGGANYNVHLHHMFMALFKKVPEELVTARRNLDKMEGKNLAELVKEHKHLKGKVPARCQGFDSLFTSNEALFADGIARRADILAKTVVANIKNAVKIAKKADKRHEKQAADKAALAEKKKNTTSELEEDFGSVFDHNHPAQTHNRRRLGRRIVNPALAVPVITTSPFAETPSVILDDACDELLDLESIQDDEEDGSAGASGGSGVADEAIDSTTVSHMLIVDQPAPYAVSTAIESPVSFVESSSRFLPFRHAPAPVSFFLFPLFV